ncbi:FkbM family methyltransferase [Desulfotomaculum sp. 1211_IL3151]|uniref:FkbM family methyltransferase n=1 Tax=Desulfotomaculum sp. 1211_IL3151 TaxID=3084055 RepID=UPI002FDAF7DC
MQIDDMSGDVLAQAEGLYGLKTKWDCITGIIKTLNIPNDLQVRANKQDIILFGTGLAGKLAQQYFNENNVSVKFWCDNDASKQGSFLDGILIISPEELARLDNPLVVITAKHYTREISEQLQQLSIPHISFDAYVVAKMQSEIRFVYSELLEDDHSKNVLVAVLKSMLLGTSKYCREVMERDEFFSLPEFLGMEQEVFVDAGAYVGDTLERFIWNVTGVFQKIYAFEPGKIQFEAMERRLVRLSQEWGFDPKKVRLVRAGLGETDSFLSYSYNCKSPSGSHFGLVQGAADEDVQVYSLDSYIGDETVSMIKVDIEGFELSMLKGARNLIKRCKPKLAISIYHKPEDLFEIPRYIHSLVPEYKMAIRHHSPRMLETILYCWK